MTRLSDTQSLCLCPHAPHSCPLINPTTQPHTLHHPQPGPPLSSSVLLCPPGPPWPSFVHPSTVAFDSSATLNTVRLRRAPHEAQFEIISVGPTQLPPLQLSFLSVCLSISYGCKDSQLTMENKLREKFALVQQMKRVRVPVPGPLWPLHHLVKELG